MTRATLRPLRLARVAALLALLATPVASAQPVPAARFDAVLTKGFAPDQPGAAVIVVKDGAVVYRKAIGMASMELGVPLRTLTFNA